MSKSSGGGGGSTTRHVIEVMYQVTGLDKAGTGITSLNKSVTQGQTTLDKFGMSATKASTETTKLANTAKTAAPSIDKTSVSTEKLDKSMVKSGNSAKGLAEKFRGNRGLIFSTTMLSSGIFEAIGMFQGWTDAHDKLAEAQAKVADLEARGLQNTKDYAEAVKDAEDAQRGYNFITRFTIQSFADLIPMSLMMVSSLTDLGSKFMQGATMKEKFAAAGGKVVSALKAVGNAMMHFTTRHPLLLLLTALTAAALAIITNFGGVRDRLNEFGVAVGNAIPGLRGFLDWLGKMGNGFSDSAMAAMGYSQKTTTALKDVEAEVLRTGDATTLSINDQIQLYTKLGDEAENVSFSLSAHLKMQQDDQKEHTRKYEEFVKAIQSGDQDIMDSMGLTAEEFKQFYKEWQEEIENFDKSFSEHVDKIVENFQTFGSEARKSQEGLVDELDKLTQKLADHYMKREEGEKMDKDARKKWRDDLRAIQGDIDELTARLSQMALEAAQDWNTFADEGKAAMERFSMEAVGGNFQGAIDTIREAIDDVPDRYKGNMNQAVQLLDNEFLSAEARADLFVANMDKLDPFKSFIVGAHEYTRAQAEVTAGLDELGVAARANVTNVNQMDAAWAAFVKGMTPAQRELPIVKSAMEGVATGAISAKDAFAMVEAAGRTMSATLGETVTQSFEDLKKTIIDLPGETSAVFADINGQVVKVGEVSDQSLVSGPKSAVSSMKKVGDGSKIMYDTIELNLGQKAPESVKTFETESSFSFDSIIKKLGEVMTELGKLPQTIKTALSTENIKAAWDGFRNAFADTGTWINTGINAFAAAIKQNLTIEKAKSWWTGFHQAIAEGKDVIISGLATIGTTIATDIKTKALGQQWWKGFWDAMSGTVTWIAGGIKTIGAEITKNITAKTAEPWWKGFQDALYSSGAWVKTQVTSVGKAITAEMSVTNTAKWWKGFQDALYSSGAWVKTQVTSVGKAITAEINVNNAAKWWKGFQEALGNSTTWVSGQMQKIANAITSFDWAKTGTDIWNKIKGGIDAALKSAGDFLGGIWDTLTKGNKDGFFGLGAEASSGGGMVDLGTAKNMMGIPQKPQIDISAAVKALDQLKAYANTTTTQISSFFTTMESSIKGTMARIGSIFSTAFTTLPSLATQATSQASAAFVTMETSIKGTLTRIASVFSTAFTTLPTSAGQQTAQASVAFMTMETSIKGTFTRISSSFPTAFSTLFTAASQATSQASAAFTTMEASINATLGRINASYARGFVGLQPAASQATTQASVTFTTMEKSITSTLTRISSKFPSAFNPLYSAVVQATGKAIGAFGQMEKAVIKSLSQMQSKVQSFGSAAASSFQKVGQQADAATKKVQALQKAINSLKDKRINIYVGLSGPGAGYLRHGGSFISLEPTGFAALGKSWVNSKPRKIGGVNISEFGKPELVTVTPLSDPGNPMDKNINLGMNVPKPQPIPSATSIGSNPFKGSGTGGTGGQNQPIQVTGNLYVTVKTQNGKVLAQEVQPYLLDGFSGVT